MKFTKQDYQELKQSLKDTGIDFKEQKKAYSERMLSETRYIWDMFWATTFSRTALQESREYNDSHIQTAVKRAIKELN